MWVSKDLTKHHRCPATTTQRNEKARAVEVVSAIATTCRARRAAAAARNRQVIGRVHGRRVIQLKKVIDLHTFSIAARDRETGAFGVAVATARPNVGSLVPWVSVRGAIATQARVNTELGRQGLALLSQGVPVDVALSALLRKDGEREIRQVHGLDAERAFCHTGGSCVPWCGHEQGDVFTVAGNMLAGPDVIAAMSRAFREPDNERRDFSDRLLLALEAGQKAGGDKRGKQSAALLVAAPREPRMYHNLRVDDHAEPVAELRRVWDVVVTHTKQIETEYGSAAVRLFGRVKY
jgi:uncharacterized Ntn-hydrolase superfamily protein